MPLLGFLFDVFAPCFAFAAIRLSTGGGALDVNYAGDTGAVALFYLSRLWTQPADMLLRNGLVFGVLWAGGWVRKDAVLQTLWRAYVPLILLATLLFSSRITRVEGAPLVAVVVPSFLVWMSGNGGIIEGTNKPSRWVNSRGCEPQEISP